MDNSLCFNDSIVTVLGLGYLLLLQGNLTGSFTQHFIVSFDNFVLSFKVNVELLVVSSKLIYILIQVSFQLFNILCIWQDFNKSS